jgi:hypothetical protein
MQQTSKCFLITGLTKIICQNGKERAVSQFNIEQAGYNGLGQLRDGFIDRELAVLQEPEDHVIVVPPVPARREDRVLPLQKFFHLRYKLHTRSNQC